MRDYLHAPKDFQVAAANTSTEWAKHQFWAWYLFLQRPSAKGYDGLDYMLLMAWVSKRFSSDMPFALMYWDLRMPNIVVDGDDNLLGYTPFYLVS